VDPTVLPYLDKRTKENTDGRSTQLGKRNRQAAST
jgi:hypothetical protein